MLFTVNLFTREGVIPLAEYWKDDPIIGQYFADIAGSTPLSREKEVELSERIKAGDMVARDELAWANLKFVVDVAQQFQDRGFEIADLIAFGNMGLITAAERFDGTKGYRFISYAVHWIRQAIQRGLADHSRTIRLPVHQVRLLGKIRKASQRLAKETGVEPEPEEIAEALDIPVEDVRVVLAAANAVAFSLDEGFGKSDTLGSGTETRHSHVPNPNAVSPAQLVLDAEAASSLDYLIDALDKRERYIVRAYYALDLGSEPKTLEEIGKELGFTREWIRQIMAIALRNLYTQSLNKQAREEGSAMSPAPSQERMLMVALDRLEPNPFQPRTRFDTEKLQELAASMTKDGLLQPIVVRQRGRDAYQIVIGERRVRAGKIAKIRELPAVLNNCTDLEMAIFALQENLQREDLNDVDRGRALVDIKTRFGFTWDQMGDRVGLTKRRVLMLAGLASLPDAVQEHIALGRLTEKHGRAVATLGNSQLQEQFAEAAMRAGLSGDSAIEAAKLLRKDPNRDVDRAVQAVAKPDAGDTWKVRVTRLRRAVVQLTAAANALELSELPREERARLSSEVGSFLEGMRQFAEQLAEEAHTETSAAK